VTPSHSPLRALAANRLLRREAGALALYRLAEFGPWVAMLLFAYAQGGAAATGLVSLALLVPTALFAPFAGPLIDRFGASRVLLGAYLMQGGTMAGTAVSLLAGAPPGLGDCPTRHRDRRGSWRVVRHRRDRAGDRRASLAAPPEGRCRGRRARGHDRLAQVAARFSRAPCSGARRVARKTHTFSVVAGASIVRQGEPGDRYYAIADGTVEVVKDGSRVATHGRGEGLGEIPLLHGITRTASVFAVTTATLTAIDREPFLVAVTGHGQTHERFEGVASYRLAVDSS